MFALTGGCSSNFSPASGFALKFANTPSDPDPPPYTRVAGVKAGMYVAARRSTSGATGVLRGTSEGVAICSADADEGLPLISRCLSSPSLSSSLSDPSASNVSARFWSTGDSASNGRREVTEEARDRKEGGGEEGVALIGVSISWFDTCRDC